tara:strand:+ start:1571 stop:1831 length:261 start_codon:yes stop_codon:yes gene_type:complete
VVFVTDRSKRFLGTVRRWIGGGAVDAAAALLLMFADFEIGVRNGRFHFAMGARSTGVDAGQFDDSNQALSVGEFAAIQRDYFELTR